MLFATSPGDVETLITSGLDVYSGGDDSKIYRRELCVATSQPQPIKQLSLPPEYPLSDLLEGPAMIQLKKGKELELAVCRFRRDNHSDHFPHAFQQLYRCVSWWKHIHSVSPSLQPALLAPKDSPLEGNRFWRGWMWTLKQMWGLRLIRFRGGVPVARAKVLYGFDNRNISGGWGFATHKMTDLWHMRRDTIDLLFKNDNNRPELSSVPRIGILNRNRYVGRTLWNADQLRETLEKEILLETPFVVTVQSLENATFTDQVDFFRKTDILISPHGAQLTGIAFLKEPCGSFLELFGIGYSVPEFYGSLAAAVGARYSYLYTGHDPDHELKFWMKDTNSRTAARYFPICLADLTPIVQHVQNELKIWKQCRQSLPK